MLATAVTNKQMNEHVMLQQKFIYQNQNNGECSWAAEHLPNTPLAMAMGVITHSTTKQSYKNSKDGYEVRSRMGASGQISPTAIICHPWLGIIFSVLLTQILYFSHCPIKLMSLLSQLPVVRTAGTYHCAQLCYLFNAAGTFKHYPFKCPRDV